MNISSTKFKTLKSFLRLTIFFIVTFMVVIFLLKTTYQKEYINFRVQYEMFINTKQEYPGEFEHFWKSTGLCPPDPHQNSSAFFLSSDMYQNLALIGSLPYQGIEQVRIHWLLDLVKLSFNSVSEEPSYDFSELDLLLERINQYGLKPGFELMGNPSNHFTDFENDTQIRQWKSLIETFAKRCIEKFGLATVSTWNFESWNEPSNHDFDSLNFTLQGLFNYYDASAEGLIAASPSLILGGPGDKCRLSKASSYCWHFLKHCEDGVNYFTGKKGAKLDYISIHQKGEGYSSVIIENEIQTMSFVASNFTKFKTIPFLNNEADPIVGWAEGYQWRADSTYPAMMAKVIAQHLPFIRDKPPKYPYKLLSNDNSFLSYVPYQFTQRTMLARFQVNNTSPPHVRFVQKPSYIVMGLLSMVGNRLLHYFIPPKFETDDINSIATVYVPTNSSEGFFEMSVLISNSKDTIPGKDKTSVLLNIYNPVKETDNIEIMYVIYQINNFHTNPYRDWRIMGKPDYPTPEQFKQFQATQGPHKDHGPRPLDCQACWRLHFTVVLPGVSFVHICGKGNSPEEVTQLQTLKVNPSLILLTWKDNSRCIQTYEIYYSIGGEEAGHFRKVNDFDVVFPSFYHQCDGECSSEGEFKIRSIDYWNRQSPYSESVPI